MKKTTSQASPTKKHYQAGTTFSVEQYAQQYGVSLEEIQEIKQVFDLFDLDLSGSIDPKQMKSALATLGFEAKHQSIFKLINDLDQNGNGKIQFPEFLQLLINKIEEKSSRHIINRLFRLFDEQKKGSISIQNLKKIAKQLGENVDEQQLQQMLEKADKNKDGLVSEQQFYHLVTKKTSSGSASTTL